MKRVCWTIVLVLGAAEFAGGKEAAVVHVRFRYDESLGRLKQFGAQEKDIAGAIAAKCGDRTALGNIWRFQPTRRKNLEPTLVVTLKQEGAADPEFVLDIVPDHPRPPAAQPHQQRRPAVKAGSLEKDGAWPNAKRLPGFLAERFAIEFLQNRDFKRQLRDCLSKTAPIAWKVQSMEDHSGVLGLSWERYSGLRQCLFESWTVTADGRPIALHSRATNRPGRHHEGFLGIHMVFERFVEHDGGIGDLRELNPPWNLTRAYLRKYRKPVTNKAEKPKTRIEGVK